MEILFVTKRTELPLLFLVKLWLKTTQFLEKKLSDLCSVDLLPFLVCVIVVSNLTGKQNLCSFFQGFFYKLSNELHGNLLVLHPYLLGLIHRIVMPGANLDLFQYGGITTMSIVIVVECHILSVFIKLRICLKNLTTSITLNTNCMNFIYGFIICSRNKNLPRLIMAGRLRRLSGLCRLSRLYRLFTALRPKFSTRVFRPI